jgi:hypothetical protein
MTINERAIRDIHHNESFIKSYFYYKNLKAVETTENYLILHLGDNPSISFPAYTNCNIVEKLSQNISAMAIPN